LRLLLAAVAAGVVLLVAELAAGGLGYGGQHVADPCKPRAALAGGGLDRAAQRFVLSGLDAAACHLGVSREQLVLDLDRSGVDVAALAERLEGHLGDVLAWIGEELGRLPRP
jgi:hypothetical protein